MVLNIPAGLGNVTIHIEATSVLTFLNARADQVTIGLTVSPYGEVGDLYGDGFNFVFSTSPLPNGAEIGVCISQATFLLIDSIYNTPDFAT